MFIKKFVCVLAVIGLTASCATQSTQNGVSNESKSSYNSLDPNTILLVAGLLLAASIGGSGGSGTSNNSSSNSQINDYSDLVCTNGRVMTRYGCRYR